MENNKRKRKQKPLHLTTINQGKNWAESVTHENNVQTYIQQKGPSTGAYF